MGEASLALGTPDLLNPSSWSPWLEASPYLRGLQACLPFRLESLPGDTPLASGTPSLLNPAYGVPGLKPLRTFGDSRLANPSGWRPLAFLTKLSPEFGVSQMFWATAEPKVLSCRPKHLYAAYAARHILFTILLFISSSR